jgi:hypothetical protein
LPKPAIRNGGSLHQWPAHGATSDPYIEFGDAITASQRVSEIVSLKLMFFVRSLHAMCRFQQVAHATEEAGIGRIRRPRFRPRASRKLSATRGVPQSMPV